MQKTLLFIGYNFFPEPTGIGKYSGEQIQWLAKKGYDCTVLASYPYYPSWKVNDSYHKYRFWYKTEVEHFASGGKITIHRCPMYVPENPTGIKRVLLDLTFLFSAFFMLVVLLPGKKFNHVITVLPSVTLGLLGIMYKKVRGAKLLCHVHDLQIEAARDLGLIKSARIIENMFRLEKYIFDHCDMITCVGEGMARKVKIKAGREVPLFLNTTDLDFFYPVANREMLKREFGFKSTDKIILYSGAIGEKQGIEAILYAANEYRNNSTIKFVICGSGPYKKKLQVLASELMLENVSFFPLQPVERFNHFLNMADVHLIVQKANAGDLVMPSKLNTVLAIGGLALVTANKGSGMHSLLIRHHMGLVVEAENQQALNEGILRALVEDTEAIVKNARAFAESHLSIERVMINFENSFLLRKERTYNTLKEPVLT